MVLRVVFTIRKKVDHNINYFKNSNYNIDFFKLLKIRPSTFF